MGHVQRCLIWLVLAGVAALARAEPVVRYGMLADYPPYQVWPADGVPGGADLELLHRAAPSLGWTLLPVRYARFDELLADLKAGHVDLASALARNPERAEALAFTAPYAPVGQALVVRADTTSATLAPDLAGRRVAVVTGYASEAAVRRLFPQAEPVSVDSVEAGLASLLDQRADVFIEAEPVIVDTIERRQLHGLAIARTLLLGTGDLHMAGPPTQAGRIAELSAALAAMGAPARAAAVQQWSARGDLVPRIASLALSDADRALLARQPALAVGVVGRQPPFSFAVNGEPRGLAVDLLRATLEQLKLPAAAWHMLDADAALAELRAGGIDVVVGLPEATLRSVPAARFVGPYLEHPLVLVGRREGGAWGLEQLGGRRVALTRALLPVNALQARHPAVEFVDCRDSADCAAQVVAGGADAFVTDVISAALLLADGTRPQLQMVGAIPELRNERGIGVAPQRRELGPLLGRAQRVAADAELPALKRRWFESLPPEQVVARTLRRVVPWAVGAVALVLALWWWHGRSLYAEVRRTAAARRDAERNAAAAARFVTFLAHEVRNSLHSVIAGAELLRSARGASAGIAEALGSSSRATLALLNNLLDRERLEAGHLALRLAAARPGPLLHAVVDEMCPAARSRGIALALVERSPLPAVHIDALRVQQVVRNLVANAIKYAGRGTVHVEVRADPDAHRPERCVLTISVRDEGPGMSEDELAHAFEPFHVGDGAAGQTAGTGLGLALGRDLAQRMGGTLTLDSRPGAGVTATLRFSAERSAEPAAAPAGDRAPTVLVVEDAEVYAMLVERAFGQAGWRATVAPSVARARECLLRERYGLLLCDLTLDDGGAGDVLDSVRLLGRTPDALPVVAVMSAELDDVQVDALRAQGADLVVAKTADVPLFVQQLLEHPALVAHRAPA